MTRDSGPRVYATVPVKADRFSQIVGPQLQSEQSIHAQRDPRARRQPVTMRGQQAFINRPLGQPRSCRRVFSACSCWANDDASICSQ